MTTTRNFSSKSAYNKAQAFIHMNIHKGPSTHPYPVKIQGKSHAVNHLGTKTHNHPSYKK